MCERYTIGTSGRTLRMSGMSPGICGSSVRDIRRDAVRVDVSVGLAGNDREERTERDCTRATALLPERATRRREQNGTRS